MALSSREKNIVGLLLIVASVGGIGLGLALPAWDAIAANQTKIQVLEGEILQLGAQEGQLVAEIQNYSKGQNLPQDLVIRKFTPDTLEKNLKEMLDQLIRLATTNGNHLISLQPVTANSASAPPPPAPAPAAGTPPPDAATATTPAPVAPPAPSLQTFDYELAVRGSYNDVVQFIASLNQYKELIEISGIEVKNEGGPQRQGEAGTSTPSRLDPARPIKLITKLKLYLVPAG